VIVGFEFCHQRLDPSFKQNYLHCRHPYFTCSYTFSTVSTVGVRGAWRWGGHFDTALPVSTSVDNAWEQEKPEASLSWRSSRENAPKWRRIPYGLP
ncbi:MAG: hypothetical protein ACYC6R_11500, partial [Anaerolineales bacterium]